MGEIDVNYKIPFENIKMRKLSMNKFLQGVDFMEC